MVKRDEVSLQREIVELNKFLRKQTDKWAKICFDVHNKCESLRVRITELESALTTWEQCGDAIMLALFGREAPLSDSDVIGRVRELEHNLSTERDARLRAEADVAAVREQIRAAALAGILRSVDLEQAITALEKISALCEHTPTPGAAILVVPAEANLMFTHSDLDVLVMERYDEGGDRCDYEPEMLREIKKAFPNGVSTVDLLRWLSDHEGGPFAYRFLNMDIILFHHTVHDACSPLYDRWDAELRMRMKAIADALAALPGGTGEQPKGER